MFKFSIRDVLWLTLVIGISLAWLIGHAGATARAKRTDKEYARFYTLVMQKCDPRSIPPIDEFPIGNKLFRDTIFQPPEQ